MKLNRRDFLKSIAALLAAVPLSKMPLEADASLPAVDDDEEEWLEDDDLSPDQSLVDAAQERENSHYQTLHIKSPLASFDVVTYLRSDPPIPWGARELGINKTLPSVDFIFGVAVIIEYSISIFAISTCLLFNARYLLKISITDFIDIHISV